MPTRAEGGRCPWGSRMRYVRSCQSTVSYRASVYILLDQEKISWSAKRCSHMYNLEPTSGGELPNSGQQFCFVTTFGLMGGTICEGLSVNIVFASHKRLKWRSSICCLLWVINCVCCSAFLQCSKTFLGLCTLIYFFRWWSTRGAITSSTPGVPMSSVPWQSVVTTRPFLEKRSLVQQLSMPSTLCTWWGCSTNIKRQEIGLQRT